MKTKLHQWLSRDLRLYRRSLLAKTLRVSQLVYAASMLTVPSLVIKNVQTELFSFLWKNKKDKIKRTVMYQCRCQNLDCFVCFSFVSGVSFVLLVSFVLWHFCTCYVH